MTGQGREPAPIGLVQQEVARVIAALNLEPEAARALSQKAVGWVCESLGIRDDTAQPGGVYAAVPPAHIESLIRLRTSAVIRERVSGPHEHTPFLRRIANATRTHKEPQS